MFGCQSGSSQNIDFQRLSKNKVIINGDTLYNKEGNQYIKYFDSGKVEYEGNVINEKQEGRWITYYEAKRKVYLVL